MYPRTNYEMTEEDHKALLDACKPTPCMMIGSYITPTPQENANDAWKALGEKMGFDYMTVRPIDGRGTRFFSAVPSETESARRERISREKEEFRQQEILRLEGEITERQKTLDALRSETQQPSAPGRATGTVTGGD